MIPNDRLKIDIQSAGGKTKVALKGIIDEDTGFEALKKLNTPLVINFQGVTSINSCGIRTWVNVIKDLSNLEITYEECPPLIVRQMNMVPSFLGHAKVTSAFVPYVCDDCDAETMTLVSADQFTAGNVSVPESMPCKACGKGEMEIDGNPKQYFAFAK
jgi:hypothetical protein